MAEGEVSLLRVEHDLTKLGKKVKSLNTKALAVLEEGLSDPDPKYRLECAKSLLKLDIDISKIINEDAMNRLVTELKIKGTIAEVPNTVPKIDFNTIQDV